MSTRKASFQASYTTSVQVGTQVKAYEDTYNIVVANNSVTVGVFNWDFTYIDDQYNTLVSEIGSSTIEEVQVAFQYNNNQDMITLKIQDYNGADPKLSSGNAILSAIQATELGEIDITSTNKTGVTIDLDDTDNLYYRIMLALAGRESVTVGLWRDTSLSASLGDVELSGKTLIGGSSEWRVATPNEPIDPPLLILTYTVDEESHPVLNMKYTTSDPTTAQSTPENSIGGYLSINDIYTTAAIREPINSTQTTIPIAATSSLPTKVGLASVGSEVFKYNAIDTTNHQLTSLERAVSPLSSFPAGYDSFKIPERVYYLSTDDSNAHLLFNTRPSTSLVQYRCIVIANTDTNDNFNIQNAVIGIAQNTNAKSQVRLGIEVPRWDAKTGIATDGTNNTSSSATLTLLVANEADITHTTTGYFDGALVKLTDPSGGVSYAITDSYSFDGATSTGEFILDREIPGLVAGWSYIIMPAPSQILPNDATAPGSNSDRFSGFDEDAEGVEIELTEHATTMQENDLFYVWLRRTITANTEEEDDTGVILIFRYRDV